ncbi:LPXTG cell wall anchor domain-containing protein [Arthrobacter pascens]|uniref:LPXTG cell wall anchor domain-containing protein n=1 Tax=Arthrobacter pascens TaxID=1677 RepID=UPI00196BA160|nr:LPXTG cell wall anchor domain-containing protein [Arthrobacter pascens]MBN3496655.1 LPXTG cell wall anchor domain-containing protein [Arthrobacter pascens]
MKKSIAALALAGTIALTGAVPAMAARYPAPPANAAVSDGVVGPGEAFTFSARNFRAGEPLIIRVTPGVPPASNGASIANGSRSVPGKIQVVLAAQELRATADASGAVALPLTINEPGVYTITATGLESGVTSDPVTVTVAGAATDLSNTGGNSGAGLANTGGNGAALANTGADSSLVLWSLVGGGALVAGAASVVVVRRRANAEASA